MQAYTVLVHYSCVLSRLRSSGPVKCVEVALNLPALKDAS